jgi:bifunctional non-homologous end joining protein LigD
MTVKSVTLYYTDERSDKVYQASIDRDGDAYRVNFAYGKRNATLTTGTKTNGPVTLEAAEKIFTKLVTEKQAKGYTEGASGTPYQSNVNKVAADVKPQLLNTIDERQASALVGDPAWLMQEKMDGRRLILRKTGTKVEGINKLGVITAVAQPIVDVALRVNQDFTLDGEVIGNVYHTFDLLSFDGNDIRGAGALSRYRLMYALGLNCVTVRTVETWTETDDKADNLRRLREANAEGVVFKRINSPYRAGRPNAGGHQFKLKFVATLSAVVARVNDKRSVSVSLLDGDEPWRSSAWVYVGDCAIPPNKEIPNVGDVVEIRYLYATAGRRIYQPVYLGVRDDILPSECTISQMKFKQTGDE